jgi:hypothetical protein
MTRRLDPFDRVRELGDASVPFPFDVHAMIFSNDAPELENLLHRRFADRRVNLVNQRREFFAVSLAEIVEVIHERDASVHVTMAAEAQQFRQSEAMRLARDGSDEHTRADDIVAEAKRLLDALQTDWSSVDLSGDAGAGPGVAAAP